MFFTVSVKISTLALIFHTRKIFFELKLLTNLLIASLFSLLSSQTSLKNNRERYLKVDCPKNNAMVPCIIKRWINITIT